jgi:hypothetical protein
MRQQLKELDAQSILLTGLRRVETSDHSIYIRTISSKLFFSFCSPDGCFGQKLSSVHLALQKLQISKPV